MVCSYMQDTDSKQKRHKDYWDGQPGRQSVLNGEKNKHKQTIVISSLALSLVLYLLSHCIIKLQLYESWDYSTQLKLKEKVRCKMLPEEKKKIIKTALRIINNGNQKKDFKQKSKALHYDFNTNRNSLRQFDQSPNSLINRWVQNPRLDTVVNISSWRLLYSPTQTTLFRNEAHTSTLGNKTIQSV